MPLPHPFWLPPYCCSPYCSGCSQVVWAFLLASAYFTCPRGQGSEPVSWCNRKTHSWWVWRAGCLCKCTIEQLLLCSVVGGCLSLCVVEQLRGVPSGVVGRGSCPHMRWLLTHAMQPGECLEEGSLGSHFRGPQVCSPLWCIWCRVPSLAAERLDSSTVIILLGPPQQFSFLTKIIIQWQSFASH